MEQAGTGKTSARTFQQELEEEKQRQEELKKRQKEIIQEFQAKINMKREQGKPFEELCQQLSNIYKSM